MLKCLSHLGTRAILRFFKITANHVKNLAGSFLVFIPAGKPLANVPIIDSTRSAGFPEARQLRLTPSLLLFVRRGIDVVEGNQDISECAFACDANGNRRSGLAVQDRLQVIPGSKKILDRRPHILNLSPVKAPRKNFSDQQCLFIPERLSKAIQRPSLSFTRKDYRKPASCACRQRPHPRSADDLESQKLAFYSV